MRTLLMVVFLFGACLSIYHGLGVLYPHLSPRDRGLVIFWGFAATGGLLLAWQMGEPAQ